MVTCPHAENRMPRRAPRQARRPTQARRSFGTSPAIVQSVRCLAANQPYRELVRALLGAKERDPANSRNAPNLDLQRMSVRIHHHPSRMDRPGQGGFVVSQLRLQRRQLARCSADYGRQYHRTHLLQFQCRYGGRSARKSHGRQRMPLAHTHRPRHLRRHLRRKGYHAESRVDDWTILSPSPSVLLRIAISCGRVRSRHFLGFLPRYLKETGPCHHML